MQSKPLSLRSVALLAIALGAAALGGCAGSASSPTMGGMPSSQSALRLNKNANAIVYVADKAASTIRLYSPSGGSEIGEITAGIHRPSGLAIDPENGDLYVANTTSGSVTVYPRGATRPSATYSTNVKDPSDVAVAKNGEVYIAEQKIGGVGEFREGGHSPYIVLVGYPVGVTVDPQNRIVVSVHSSAQGGDVYRFIPHKCCGQDLSIHVKHAGDVQFDTAGNLLLGDSANQVVGIYPPGAKTPSRTISTTGHDPYRFALSADTSPLLYVADDTTVVVYDYTTGAPQSTTFSGLKSASAVALDPGTPF